MPSTAPARLLAGLRRARLALVQASREILGEFDWRAPRWGRWTAALIGEGRRSVAVFVQQSPRRAALTGGLVVLAGVAAYPAWRWYEQLPKPVETTFEISAPGLTCYDCDPPGKPQPLIVRFSGSSAPLAQSGREIESEADLVRMTPAVRGTWRWDDDRTLRFVPDEDWPIGARFAVRFARTGLVAGHVRLAGQGFEFHTSPFEARLLETEFHQDPVVAGNKKVVVTVRFTHPVDPATFEERVTLTMFERITDSSEQERGRTAFTVVYDKLKLRAHVHSRQLDVPQKSGRLAIRVDEGVRPARGGEGTRGTLETSVSVPGLYSLQAQQVDLAVARDEREEPGQVLVITMNHSVGEREMPGKVRAWRLPGRHPDARRQKEFEQRAQPGTPFPWSAQTVTRDLLAASPPATLTAIPGEREHSELHSFRHDASPGEFLYVRLDRGLQSFGGYVLANSVERILRVPEFPRELRIAQQGSLLAMTGSRTLTVMTRDIPALRVEVGRLLPRQIQHLVTQTGGAFTQPRFQSWTFDSASVTERLTRTIRLPALEPGTPHYEPVALGDFLSPDATDRRGVFFVKVLAWDVEHDRPLSRDPRTDWNSVPYQDMADARLVVITDLGLIAKKSLDGSQDVFVQSIRSGAPLAGTLVEILGRNGLPVLSGTTDEEGHVRFADLASFEREQEPVLYLARRGGDTSFLPLGHGGRDRSLDISRFDVGGVDNRVDRGTLSAYLFCDRGLYRPGEEIRIGAIVRSQDWQRSLDGVPMRLDVVDPRGIRIRSEPFAPGPSGFGEIRHSTRETSPAGNYTVSLAIVRGDRRADLVGSVVVQVRDFLPDRLRMSLRFSAGSPDGWVSPQDLAAHVDLQNLFGTPAANRRVTARMTLSPAFPAFRSFPDYRFHDPDHTRQREGFAEQLAPATTDKNGKASFNLALARFAPATYRLHLAAEGFEADGGRGVSAEAAQLVSPLPYLVGWKPDGELGYVSRGANRAVEVIAIDPRAALTAVAGLELLHVERRFVSTLIRRNNGTFQYESRRKDIELARRELTIPAAGIRLPLATDEPGAFAYVLRDAKGLELAVIEYRVAGEANLTRTLEKNAQLQIALARDDYAPGEEIEMQIQAPYTGSGLITIERDRVYAWRWFRTTTTSSTQTIRLPAGIEGNAYVNVAFVRDPASGEIYSSPLSYGVQPFSISLKARRNAVSVDSPALVKPGETLKLRYSTAKPARIAVFAVDEGILQVARYRTPDPLGHFFQKRSLAVSTLQILDLIVPELLHRNVASAPGGDGESALGRHLNPFRRKGDAPVAYWSGILDADATPRELQYVVPDHFNGTLRIMAIAVSDDSIGVHEGSSLVRGDFVLSPNVPTTVTPGDEFEVSVGVANNLAGSGERAEIAVSLHTSTPEEPGLQILSDAKQTLTIGEHREGAARFRVRALDRLGPATLEFRAVHAASAARRAVDLSVRPATPYRASLTAGSLRRTSRNVPIGRDLHPEHRTLQAGISVTPLVMAHGLITYLDNYPYACTEQIVSQAMPALVLSERPGFAARVSSAAIEGLLDELRVRQNDAGAYRIWPGGNEVVEFVSLYAQHFLLEAAERGRNVPADVLAAGNRYLRTLAARDGDNLVEERHTAYAIYLLTRQGRLMSAESAQLRKRLLERYPKQWQQDLAAAWLAGALRLMRQDRDAQRVAGALRFGSEQRMDAYSDAMTRDGLLLYILARHFPERLAGLPAAVLENLVARIDEDAYHSLSAGTTLLALDAYVRVTNDRAAPQFAIAEVLKGTRSARALPLPQTLQPKVAFGDEASALRFSSGSELNAYYFVEESGFDRVPPKEPIARGFEILRDYGASSEERPGKPLSTVTMGESVHVRLRFRGLSERTYTDVALVDLLPGGFELVMPPQEFADTLYQAPGDSSSGEGSAPAGAQYQRWRCHFCLSQSADTLRYADPREDRVVFYATVTPDVQEIVYRIRATNVGTFVTPPAYGEAMYDRGAVARSAAGRIRVEAPARATPQ